jgi:histidine ammonia-lyase
MNGTAAVELTGRALTCDQVRAVARDRTAVRVHDDGWDRIRGAADLVARLVTTQPVYGRTTGVGANRTVAVAEDPPGRAAHGSALLRSHAGGAGPLVDADRARAMLAVRVNQLAAGGSGVSPALLGALVEALNRGLVPTVPTRGAIGTGDLSALACTALCLSGERPWHDSGTLPLVEFDPADALAFLSSNAATIGSAALACADLSELLAAGLVVAALALVAVGGSTEPYAAAVQEARPHPGQRTVAARLRALLDGYVGPGRRIQDPYGYRVLPQVHGAAVDAARALHEVLAVELNAAAENPLVDVAGGRVLHNGNFHAAYLALALDAARAALFQAAALSSARLGALVEPAFTGLPPFLADGPAGSSGVLILEYVGHAALAEIRLGATPAAVGGAVLSRGVEEHASFATQGADRTLAALDAYRTVLGCELVAAVRALRMAGTVPGAGPGAGPLGSAYELAARELPAETGDRPLDADVAAATSLLPGLARYAG